MILGLFWIFLQERCVRAVHQLTLENQELRAQLDLPEPNVTPLRRQR
jgi:hypothetical protein